MSQGDKRPINELLDELAQAKQRVGELEAELAEIRHAHDSSMIQAPSHGSSEKPNIDLASIIDSQAIQAMMDEFYKLTNIPSAVLDMSGTVLVATGWQDICRKFHRVHPDTNANCLESACSLSSGVEPGEFKLYRCKNNLWGMATPLVVEGNHLGSLFLGQFFFEDDEPDRELFRQQARQYGFDEAQYLETLDRVPRYSRERVNTAMKFYSMFAEYVSMTGYTAAKLSKILNEFSSSEKYRDAILQATIEGFWVIDNRGHIIEVNDSYCAMSGYERHEIIGMSIPDLDEGEPSTETAARLERIISNGHEMFEAKHRRKDGSVFPVEISATYLDLEGGQLVCFCRDISSKKQALSKLESTVARLNEAQLLGGLGDWDWDPETDAVTWSENMYRILGLDPDLPPPDYAGQLALYHPESAERLHEAATLALEQGRPYTLDLSRTKPDGQIVHIQASGVPERGSDGNLIRLKGTIQDITERKKAENNLRRSETHLREAQRLAKVGSWEFDIQMGEIWGSDEGFNVYGMTPPASNLLPIDEIEACIPEKKRVRQALVDLINDNTPYDLEFDIIPADGSARKTIISKAKIERDKDGAPLRVSGVIWDVTEHRKIENALKRIEWLLTGNPTHEDTSTYVPPYGDVTELNNCRVILDSLGPETLSDIASQSIELLDSSVAVYERNGDYAFGMFSSGWCRFMDASSRKLCGDMDNQDALTCGKWLCHENCWNESARAAMESGKATDIECVGGIHLYGVPIRAGAEIVGAINIGYGDPPTEDATLRQLANTFRVEVADLCQQANQYESRPSFIVEQAKMNLHRSARIIGEIVSRSRLEKRLVAAQQAAEAATRAKSEFLANMSHEIRTPMNGVLGMLQLLQTTSQNAEQKEYTLAAIQSSKRLTRLLSDILDLSRVEASRLHIQSHSFDIAKVVDQTCDLFKPTIKQSQVEFTCHVDPIIPRSLNGDAARLQQVLTNFIGNAFKFTKEGRISIEAYSLTPPGQNSFRVLFSVADTGIGIPDDKIDLLFQPFSQASTGYRREFQGAGLGLSICKRLVELMGGNIAIESEPGKGTTVHFCLTFSVDDPIQRPEVFSPAAIEIKPLRILLAEDEDVNRLATTKLLEKHGHTVKAVENGQEAITQLKAEDFDAVLMDIQMPVMDGVDATAAIRKGGCGTSTKNIPVIAMTAYAMCGDREMFLAAGMNGYIAKPVDVEQLEALLQQVLAEKDGR